MAGLAGTGVAGRAATGTGAAAVVPAFIRTVVSSRSAVARAGGSVPYQPPASLTGSERCSLCNADAVGTSGELSEPLEDVLGLRAAKTVRDSRIP